MDVELRLAPGAVADTNGRAVAEAGQVVELLLGHDALALHAVDDLHGLVAEVAGGVGDPAEEPLGLLRAGGDPQRAHREAQVAQPREAVVEVQLAAELLGQRGAGRGDDRARGLEGQALDDERAASHGLGVLAAVVVVQRRPRAPAFRGVRERHSRRLGRIRAGLGNARRELHAISRGDP